MVIDENAHIELIDKLKYTRDHLTNKHSAYWYYLNDHIERLEIELRYWR